MELTEIKDKGIKTIEPKKAKRVKIQIPLDIQEKKFKEKTGQDFPVFFEKYLPKLIYYTSSICRDDQEAEDISIDSFKKSLEEIDMYDKEKAQFSTWLFTIARNLVFQRVKERKRFVSMDKDIDEDGASIKDFIKDSGMEDDIDKEISDLYNKKASIMKRCISDLKQPYRQVIEMRELSGMHYKDIADKLGLKLSTLKSQIRNGRIILKKMVKKEFEILDSMYL